MTDKERCDVLMKLAELQSNIREKRRDIEWKVSIGLWVITSGAVVYLKGRPLGWSLGFLAIVVLAHSLLWVRVHFNSSEQDAKQVYYYMHHALRIVRPESVDSPGERLPFRKFGMWEFLHHQPLWFQILLTLILGLIVIIVSR